MPPVGSLHAQPGGMCSSSAPASAAQCAAYSARVDGSARSKWPARPYSSTIRWPSAPAHWSVFCLAVASWATSSAGPAAQPSRTPGQKTFENVPAWSTTSGPSDHSDGSESPPKDSSR